MARVLERDMSTAVADAATAVGLLA